jgi:hypothetical protein
MFFGISEAGVLYIEFPASGDRRSRLAGAETPRGSNAPRCRLYSIV